MESKQKVIRWSNLPVRSPIPATVIYITALDYWNAPQWTWGIFGLILFVMWGNWVLSFFSQESVNIFEDNTHSNQYDFTKGGYTGSERKSQFRDMLDQQLADAKAQREELLNEKNK